MIFLSKTTADIDGRMVLRNYQVSGEYENTARISRDKTLDGGSAFSHLGVSDTDRDFVVECRMTPDEGAKFKALFANATVLRISFWEGVFKGYVYRFKWRRDGKATITFLFMEKMA
ncbi:hypothetical protein [uncultured Desulfosarcina sp.]|uniref:hypothetical protein n=1 Tax=uncultured Desulfosarcina sp. TaxID=218289 RepID=UPI0029C727CF|nr:hypothetical protein [uncultured Desulfosarcina sp.]